MKLNQEVVSINMDPLVSVKVQSEKHYLISLTTTLFTQFQ